MRTTLNIWDQKPASSPYGVEAVQGYNRSRIGIRVTAPDEISKNASRILNRRDGTDHNVSTQYHDSMA